MRGGHARTPDHNQKPLVRRASSCTGSAIAGRSMFSNFETTASPRLFGWRGHRDLEHAILERRLGLIRDHAFGKRNDAMEPAITPLRAVHAFALLFVLTMTLAFNRQLTLSDVHLHIIFGEAGQIDADEELAASVEHFHIRGPQLGGQHAAPRLTRAQTSEPEVVENAIHLVRKPLEHAERSGRP